MAFLILDSGGTDQTDSGGYYDFNPENSNDVNEMKNLLTARYSGKDGKTVTLLSSSSEEDRNIFSGIAALIQRVFKGKGTIRSNRRPTRQIPAAGYCARPRRRTNRNTSDLSMV